MPFIVIDIPVKGVIPSQNGPSAVTQQPIGSVYVEKAWSNTTDFKRKLASHNLPMNTYRIFRNENWRGQGRYEWWPLNEPKTPANTKVCYGIPYGNLNADLGTSITPTAQQTAKLKASIEAKLLLKIKNQKVNLAQAYAERKRTAEMISRNIQRIIAAFRALRRKQLDEALAALGAGPPSRRRRRRINTIWYGTTGRQGSAPSKDEFRNAAAVWLEIQYGWRPLLNDIYESAKEIAAATDQSPRKVVTTQTGLFVDNSSRRDEGISTSMLYRIEKKVVSVLGKATVWYSTPNSPRTLSQLGFTNPAYLAWELTPFSFVVDWFLPIGNALNAFDATLGLTFDKGCYSQKINASIRTTGFGKDNSIIGVRCVGGSTTFRTEKRFDRSPYSSFPSVVFPDFKNPLSVEHALNAIALLVQVFTGKAK